MQVRRIILIGAAVVGMTVGTSFLPVHADGLSISLERVVFGNDGDVVLLATENVVPALVGSTCTASYTGENNGSVHPGNDLIIASASATLVLAGVEDAAGITTNGSGVLTLGNEVRVSVRLGSDGMASLGASLSLTCAPIPDTTPTTMPAGAAATTIASTTILAATTVADTTAPTGVSVTTTSAGDAGVPGIITTTSTEVASAGPAPAAPTLAGPSPAAPTPAGTSPLLPATGSTEDQLATLALASVLGGALLCLSRRRATPDEGR